MAKRLVRRLPLGERIKAYPLDLILSLNESFSLIDWDDYVPSSLPGGSALCLIFTALCKLSNYHHYVSQKRDNRLFSADLSIYANVRARAISGKPASSMEIPKPTTVVSARRWLWLVNSSLLVLASISILNAIYVLYLSEKHYTLLNSSVSSAPPPKASNVFTLNMSYGPATGIIQKFLRLFESSHFVEEDTDSDNDVSSSYEALPTGKNVYVMRVWDPSSFQLHLFGTFCPITLLSIWLMSSSVHFWKLLCFICLFNCLLYSLVSWFFLLISDKQIIYQETFNEYNKKFVIPKTTVLKKNAIVDATFGPFADPERVVHDDLRPHIQNEYAFITHDINGRRIKSVRGDNLNRVPSRLPSAVPSRVPSPQRSPTHNQPDDYSTFRSARYRNPNDWYRSSPPPPSSDLHHPTGFYLSTPYLSRIGDLSFIRPKSPRHSPAKTPTRISFSQRTQLSPSRVSPSRGSFNGSNISGNSSSSAFSSRAGSPQRSPLPSKRPWL